MLRQALSCAFLLTASAALHSQVPLGGGPAAGRVLWLRGDRGVQRGLSDLVTDWRDVNAPGNGTTNAASTALPEWRAAEVNGQPALHFDGNDFLFGYGMPIGSYTKVAVCQLDDLTSTNNVFANFTWHELYFAGSDRARLSHGVDFVTSQKPVRTGTPIVLVASYDASTGEGVLYQDGELVGRGLDGMPQTGDSSILLGSFAIDSYFSGSIAEVMAYDHVLTRPELSELQGYLRKRYHLDPAPIVSFERLPRPGQLFQRDDSGSALVGIAGSVKSCDWSAVRLEITCDGSPFDSAQQVLSFAQGSAPFDFTRMLPAGKHDYELSLYALRASEQRLVARIGNVAVGDIWLINGQSNAVAADYFGEQLANAECQSHWVRSFGTATTDSDAPFDLHWGLADGEDIYSHATVGAWGLRMGALLEQTYAMPIGLINGAVGGTSIEAHLRDDTNPMDLRTLYGRLLYRVEAAGVKTSLRGMLWYQGEADGNAAGLWQSRWLRLKQSWQFDYPALAQIYLFQIRNSCGSGAEQLREVQRELLDNSNNTYVMSTTAVVQHDGCHFHYLGYRELGDRIARVLGRDFYASLDTVEIDPPNILNAAWKNAAQTQILLTFRDLDDRLVFDPGAEADFFTDDGVAIQSGMVSANSVLLQLAGPSNATTISYAGHPLDGPWLKNARQVGALTFFGVAIE